MKSFAINMCDLNQSCIALLTRPRASGPQHTTRPLFSYGHGPRRRRWPIRSHGARRRTQHWIW